MPARRPTPRRPLLSAPRGQLRAGVAVLLPAAKAEPRHLLRT